MNSNLKDKLIALTMPTTVIELTPHQAEELGAFEEDALSELDALEASDIKVVEEGN